MAKFPIFGNHQQAMTKNWGLVIGINHYQRLRSLQYAQYDAQVMQNFFLQEAAFEKVFYFADDAEPLTAPDNSLYYCQPTYGHLWSFLQDFFESPQLETGDNFWFFFSGHGIRHENRDYLMPTDGHPQAIEQTALPLYWITERLRRCGADNVILLIDACRDEDKGGLGVGRDKPQGVVTVFSCQPKEKSYEVKELQQGAFTYSLLEALRIRGEENCATVERLYQFLKTRVPQLNQQYGYQDQTPYVIAEPATKLHLILLPKKATDADLALLREDALTAEAEENFKLAEQLWRRVLAIAPNDSRSYEGVKRTIQKQVKKTSQDNSQSKFFQKFIFNPFRYLKMFPPKRKLSRILLLLFAPSIVFGIWQSYQYTQNSYQDTPNSESSILPSKIESSIPEDSPSRGQSIFFCKQIDGVPTTIALHHKRREVEMISWTKDSYFENSDYTNEKRCKMVSKRFQKTQEKGILNYIVSGNIEGKTALCASREKPTHEVQTCTDEQLLLILEPSQNPQEIIEHINNINKNRTENPVEL